jgi:hypothetical protein
MGERGVASRQVQRFGVEQHAVKAQEDDFDTHGFFLR